MNTLVICPKCEKSNRVDLERATAKVPICGNCRAELPLHHGVQDLDSKTFAQLLRRADRPVVVDFWAPWCGPCRAFAPTYQTVAKEMSDHFIFAKLNTESAQEAALHHRVRAVPTLVVFDDGKERARQSGALSPQALKDFLWAAKNLGHPKAASPRS